MIKLRVEIVLRWSDRSMVTAIACTVFNELICYNFIQNDLLFSATTTQGRFPCKRHDIFIHKNISSDNQSSKLMSICNIYAMFCADRVPGTKQERWSIEGNRSHYKIYGPLNLGLGAKSTVWKRRVHCTRTNAVNSRPICSCRSSICLLFITDSFVHIRINIFDELRRIFNWIYYSILLCLPFSYVLYRNILYFICVCVWCS